MDQENKKRTLREWLRNFDGEHSGKGGLIVDEVFECNGDGNTPFGMRWGGSVITLKSEHLSALSDGKYVAIEIESEYVAFLKLESLVDTRD